MHVSLGHRRWGKRPPPSNSFNFFICLFHPLSPSPSPLSQSGVLARERGKDWGEIFITFFYSSYTQSFCFVLLLFCFVFVITYSFLISVFPPSRPIFDGREGKEMVFFFFGPMTSFQDFLLVFLGEIKRKGGWRGRRDEACGTRYEGRGFF